MELNQISTDTGIDFGELMIKESMKALAPGFNQAWHDTIGTISDGANSFNDLYRQRTVLLAVIARMFPERSWVSNAGLVDYGMFHVGIETREGKFRCRCEGRYFGLFAGLRVDSTILEYGKVPEVDVQSLLSLELTRE